MPSEKILLEKQKIVSEVSEKLSRSVSCIIVDYKGITVSQDNKLRADLRSNNIEYFVIKNNLLKRALIEAGFPAIDDFLKGASSIALSYDDPVAPAKTICDYSKKLDSVFNVKVGFIDKKIIDASAINDLAKLPSKETLIAMTLYGLNAPITGLANVLNANIRNLAVLISEISKQKSA